MMELKDDHSIQNKNGETITLSNKDICKKDLSLAHLVNCKIFIYGTPGTVHINNASNCLFVIGPVSGSVFVERYVYILK